MKKPILITVLALLLMLLSTSVFAQDTVDFPPADVINDEGGNAFISGEVNFTVGFLSDFGAGSVVVLMNDASSYVDRNLDPDFTLPDTGQLIGDVTSDPLTSPFTYTFNLPIIPRGEARDVDNDSKEDLGVVVMTIDVYVDMFGDPYWEDRREYGAGLNSVQRTNEFDLRYEVVGGTLVVWAPDDEQGFPSGFGDDGLLFTEDDPIVTLPEGYTVVNLDTAPFTFDRARNATVDLIENDQSLQPADYSDLTYTEAFDALIEQMRREYSFTELKEVDFDALYEEFAPRFAEAEANNDFNAYATAIREFTWQIPDGHVGASLPLPDAFFEETDGGLGMAITELDDGRVIVSYLTPGGPAAEAGIELGAEIQQINGEGVSAAIDATIPWSSPFSTEDRRRLQQLRYVHRFPVDTDVELVYLNPDATDTETITLTTIAERDSFSVTSFFNDAPPPGTPPLEFEILESGYGYARFDGFSDNPLILLRMWEWMIDTLNAQQVPGLIIDIRDNGGGYNIHGQMAGFFFNEEVIIGNESRYYDGVGFFVDPIQEEILRPAPDGRYYGGEVAVLVGPNCGSACEFFAYNMSLNDRAAIVGQYTTSGLGGSITPVFLPDGVRFQFTISRALDAEGNIRLEGIGVPPTVDVPVDEETVFYEGDVILDSAVEYLDEATQIATVDGGTITIGAEVTGQLNRGERVQYTLNVANDEVLDFVVTDPTGELDTVLRLYVAGNPQVAAENDDDPATGSVNSALRELSVPGGLTLIVEVGSFLDAAEGEFTISITQSEGN